MAKRRRTLLDLYTQGKEVVFGDERELEAGQEPDKVIVWVQKLSPAEHETAVRKASAERARARAELNDHDSEAYLAIYDDVIDYDRETMVLFLSGEKEAETRLSIESELELGDDTEWGKDGYARSLVDLWAGGLEQRYIEDPTDPEVAHVLGEMRRFSEEVTRRLQPVVEDLRTSYGELPTERLREMTVERVLESQLSAVWMREYERCKIWLGTREPANHAVRYLPERELVDHLDPTVREKLLANLEAISVSATAGKDSPGSRLSSRSAVTLAMAAGQYSPDGAEESTTSPKS